MPVGIMNDEVAKLPLSEGHNAALNRRAFRTAAGRRRRRGCWGLSDTPLIRGSSSEVAVCTMKHVDGATMTHMLHLTGGDLDVGLKGRKGGKKTMEREQAEDFPPQYPRFKVFPVRPAHAPAYWLALRENALSLLKSGPDSSAGDGEQ